MSKIAVVLGSPRANGNTRMLADAFIRGAEGHNGIDMIQLGGMNISPCRECNYCYRNEEHECFQKDEMTGVIDRLSKADVIVIASPVYFYGLSAQMKAAMDRLHTPRRNDFKVKGLVLLAVGAMELPNLFDSVNAQYDSILSFFKLKDYGRVLVGGVKEPGDIRGRKELDDAENIGRSI